MTAHLTSASAKQLKLSIEARIAIIRNDRWIGTPTAQALLSRLFLLIEAAEKLRMEGMVMVGPYNNGKSMVIERCRQLCGGDPSKILVVESPATGGLARIYAAILRAFNAPYSRSQGVSSLERQVYKLLHDIRPRVLVFDDFQHIVKSGRAQVEKAFSLFRSFGYEIKNTVVLVGDIDVLHAVRADDQMASRLEEAYVPRWEYDRDWLGLLASLESVLPLKEPSNLAGPFIARDVFTLSEGLIGEAVKLLTQAAEKALRTGGERITPEVIKALNYVPLSERANQIDPKRLI